MRAKGRNVVTAASWEAVQAGIGILAAGGNAADAAAAVLLTSCVTDLGAVCLGGEAAVIVFDAATGTPAILAAQGGAPTDPQAIEWVCTQDAPLTGIRAATAPAVLDLCVTLLESYGSMPFADVVRPALSLLESGRSETYFDTSVRKQLDALTGAVGAQKKRGTPAHRWSDDLARTLSAVAAAERSAAGSRQTALEAAADTFRNGEIAGQLAAWYRQQNAFLHKRDLETHRTLHEEPLAIDHRGHRILKAGTWTQGAWLLQALRLLDGADAVAEYADEAGRAHLMAEAIKLSIADWEHHFGDPRFVDVPIGELLSQEYAALRRQLIDPGTAGTAAPGDPIRMQARLAPVVPPDSHERSTIACITADRFGNVVVMTPSGVGSTAGSGGATGMTHGTRLRAARRDAGHPNTIAAGKRPCVTLSPTLTLKSGRPAFAMCLPGGSFQDQVALHLVLAVIDRGWQLDDIIERDTESSPVLVHWDANGPVLRVQKDWVTRIGDALVERGHRVEPTSLSFRRLGGSAVFVDPDTGEFDAVGPKAGAC